MQKIILTILLLSIALVSAVKAQSNSDTVMILPFKNSSPDAEFRKTEFNWVGESFAESLADLLTGNWSQVDSKVKLNHKQNSLGINIISNDERKLIQQGLKIPLTSLPSLATSMKIAQKGRATILVLGDFSIIKVEVEKDVFVPTVVAKVQIIDVRNSKFMPEMDEQGRPIINSKGNILTKEIIINETLTDLQKIQGEVAYSILYKLDRALSTSQNQFITAATRVPARAFEAYIKGLLTAETDLQTRENYFKNALRIYSADELTKGGTYNDVALELGHLFRNQNKYNEAIDYFSRVPVESSQYAEAAFYTGLIQWQQKNYERALAVLRPLADDLKLTSVYNILGAIAVQSSLAEKKNKGNADKLLQEGLGYLKKASDSAPDDTNTRFNYAFALFLNNNYKESADYLSPVLAVNQGDGESYFLLAKALEKTGDERATGFDDKAKRFLTANNRYAKLETDWKSGKADGINLRVEQPARKDFVSVILIKKQATPTTVPVNETETLLSQARTFYENGNDDEAMDVLRRVLAGEPMSAGAYLLLGNIYSRQGNLEQAVSSLKTALFWDNKLINAHVELGKIYLQRKECQQAETFSKQALTIDPENQEALGLQRQVGRCSK